MCLSVDFCVCLCGLVCMSHETHVRRSEDEVWELGLSFYPVASGN